MVQGGGCLSSSPLPAAPRTAGAVSDADDVVILPPAQASVDAGKLRSIARGVALFESLGYMTEGRDAGDVRSGTASGVPPGMDAGRWWAMSERERDAWFSQVSTTAPGRSRADELFDPADPASMTETRWRAMSESERRSWLDANVRDAGQRNAMISSVATGVFDTVRSYISAERERRLTEIRESANTRREEIRADADVERARLDADVRRAQIAADTARAEAQRAQAEAVRATTEADRASAAERASAAQERASAAQAAADRAAADRATAEAQAARERALSAGSSSGDSPGFFASNGVKVVAGGAGLVVVGLLLKAVMEGMRERSADREEQDRARSRAMVASFQGAQ